jgi:hypothetical protein
MLHNCNYIIIAGGYFDLTWLMSCHIASKIVLPVLSCGAGFESLEIFRFNGQNGGGHLAGTCQGKISDWGKHSRTCLEDAKFKVRCLELEIAMR